MGNAVTEEFISRTEVLEDFEACNTKNPNWTPQRVKTLLLRQQTADAVRVVHGRWVKNDFLSDDINTTAACSLCGELIGWFGDDPLPYCPFCNAHMDGGDEQ